MRQHKSQSKYLFKVIWSKTYIGIAINEKHKENLDVPLTTFYFWPREEGWELLKAELDSKPWINEKAKIEILNGYCVLLNFWLKTIYKTTNTRKLNTKSLPLNIDLLGVNTMD